MITITVSLITIWVFIKLFIFWFQSITSVMSTSEEQLPSKYDKILWVTLFLFIPIIAPFIYTSSVEKYNQKET